MSDGADDKLMLLGHDAVAYFTQNDAVKGDPNIKLEHLGVTYRFSSEANKAEFQKNPEKYMPQFGGFCSNGAPFGIKMGSDPTEWEIVDGLVQGLPAQARAALVERIELSVPGFDEHVVVGFRTSGAGSVFFGQSECYQFNSAGELRRDGQE